MSKLFVTVFNSVVTTQMHYSVLGDNVTGLHYIAKHSLYIHFTSLFLTFLVDLGLAGETEANYGPPVNGTGSLFNFRA